MLPQAHVIELDDDEEESTTTLQTSSILNNNTILNHNIVSSSNGESRSRSSFVGAFSIDDSFSGDNDAVSPFTPSKRKLEEIKSFEEPSEEDDDDAYGDVNLDQLIMNYEKSKSTSSSSDNSSSYFVTGSNMFGMLGLGNPVSDTAKISSFTRLNNPAIEPSQVKFMACGHYHTILLTKDNQLYACGKNNYGQLGMGNLTKVVNIFKFVDSSLNGMPKESITDIKCGRYHTMFITNQPYDNVWVCGKNKTGQMSLPSLNIYPSPQRLVSQFSGKVLFASCGSEYTFIKTTDNIYACGDNSRGQCGVGLELPQIKKFTVVRDPLFIRQDVVQIECGEFHTLFLTASGEIWGAGTTVNGQLGFDPQNIGNKQNLVSPTKIPISTTEPIKTISCGFHHSAFLTRSGKIFICGRNGDGQLATGETVPRLFSFTHIPLSASSLGHHFVQDLYCYSYYSIAITDKREMFLTGSNKCGQLGCLETPKIEKFTRTFKHRVKNVYCGRDTLMVEAENKEYNEAVHEDTLGKLLDFDNEDIMSLLDSYIICSDEKKYPILYDFVMARFPFFEQFSKEVSDISALEERPTKKRKSRDESSMRIIDLSSVSTLSSKSVLKILKYIYTDVLDDFGTSIQEDLDVILWIAEKSNKDFSSGPPSISNIARYVKLVLQNTLSSITNGTVVKTLSALQPFKNHPLIESIYRHCIALIRKIEKTYTINEIKDYNDLSKEALIEALTAGENYHCLGSSDVSIPPSTFSEDMDSLYNKTQTTNSGDVKLVLSKSTTIHAHKAILAVKCDFFRVKFTSGMCDMDSFDVSDSEEEDKEEVQAHVSFIKYLYTNHVLLNGSNAVSFLTKWNFYSMDINHQISLRCQSIIIEGLTESNVLEFQKSFFFDRASPYHHLRKACVQALISYWPEINQRYTKKQIQDHMTFDQYIKITQSFLKLQAKTNNNNTV